MTADLVAFLRARLDEDHTAVLRYRDGHEGPCLNYRGQDPEGYDEYDSCYLHIEAAEATPYRDVAFGLADIDAKRRILNETWGGRDHQDLWVHHVRLLALPYAGHPDYREEWRP